MEPSFSINDIQLFYRYLDTASYYFEYGTGGSTYQASIRQNILKIISVECDYIWHNQFKFLLQSDRINFIYCDMDCNTHTWGRPGPNSTINDWKNYSDQIRNVDHTILNKIDLILIDERFRVACCLKCFDVINDNCLIVFDDFLNRPEYHIVLDYYDIIDKSNNNIMVILKKKNTGSPSSELIEQYEHIKQ